MLIYLAGDDTGMAPYLLLGFLLLVVVLAPLYGVDSRVDEIGRRRKLRH